MIATESDEGIGSIDTNEAVSSYFIGIIEVFIFVYDILFILQKGNRPVENIHREELNSCQQRVFNYFREQYLSL